MITIMNFCGKLVNILKSLPVWQINIFCNPLSCKVPSVEKLAQLVRQSIDTIVDVGTKGAGYSQSKMREDSGNLHPGRPGHLLEKMIISYPEVNAVLLPLLELLYKTEESPKYLELF